MKYKLIVSDYDDTLLRTDLTISESTISKIKQYQSVGGKFVICTGRMLSSIKKIANSKKLSGEIVGCQGSVIYSIDRGELLVNSGLDYKLGLEIIKNCEQFGEHIHIYINDNLFVHIYDDGTKLYEKLCDVKANVLNYNLSNYVESEKPIIQKILILCNSKDSRNIYNRLKNKFSDRAVVSISNPKLVEIVDNNYSKGKAIEFLANYYKIDISEVIAVGDSLNDMTMIKTAGLGIAVGNACDELKQVAKEISVSCDENAVEYIISKYGLEEL